MSERHHNSSRPISRRMVPPAAVAFMAELIGAHRTAEYFRKRYAP